MHEKAEAILAFRPSESTPLQKNEKQPTAMTTPNTHITEYLEYYCQLEQAPEYAVLLKGKWGSGKTWFIHQFLTKLNEGKQVKHLYVSLYGMTAFSEIEDEFFKQLHPSLSSKSMQLAEKIAKGLLKTTIKVDLDDDGKPDGSVSSQIPEINLPKCLTDTSEYIFVFDDLERASIDLKSLLGYINHFVEHRGYKVILIANEEEILEQQKENGQQQGFARIKEKLVGKTFEVEADFNGALQYFISTLACDKTKKVLQEHLASVEEIYFKAKYFNLRHLKQALWDFERLLPNIGEKFIKEEELITHLIQIFLAFSFEIKSGNLETSSLKKLTLNQLQRLFDNGSEKHKSNEIAKKYFGNNRLESLLPDQVWFEIFDKGTFPKAKINEALQSSKYYILENMPDWKKLWHYMDLTDEQFSVSIEKVKYQLKNNELSSIGEIKHATMLLIYFSASQISSQSQEKTLSDAFKHVDFLKNNQQLNVDYLKYKHWTDTGVWDGLSFLCSDSEEFKKLNKYIKNAHEQAYEEDLPEKGEKLLELMTKDSQQFYQLVVLTQLGESPYHDKPVFDQIDQNEFVQTFTNMTPEMRQKAALAFSSRYQHNHYITNLLPELDWLKGIKTKLEEKATTLVNENKITGFQIKKQIDNHFTSAIEALNKANLDKNSSSE